MILDGYVRVSQTRGRTGESFISVPHQRERIERWVELHDATIGHIFEELDASGGKQDRPLLETAIRRVESGETDGVVVAYLSRFTRSLMHALVAIERITKADGTFVSVEEGLDFSSDTGRLVLRFLFSFAEWELDRVRTNWLVASERAIERGVWIGSPPFGYARDSDGRLTIHPREGPVVRELFRRRANGESIASLRRYLLEAEIRTAHGHEHWDTGTIRGILRRRAHVGESRYGSCVNRHAHPALIDGALWESAQVEPNRELPPQLSREPPLLRGILRCGGCRRMMYTSIRYGDSSRETCLYLCNGHRNTRSCPAPTQIDGSIAEPFVEKLFWQELHRARRRPAFRRIERLRAKCLDRQAELAAYRDNAQLPLTLGPRRFAEGIAVRVKRTELARAELARAELSLPTPLFPPTHELRASWGSLDSEKRRSFIAQVIECVFVMKARSPTGQRLHACIRGDAPTDLPGAYERPYRHRPPFDASAHQPGALVAKAEAPRSAQRVRADLKRFVEGRTRWPSFSDFQAAGAGLLYDEAKRHGGDLYWARELEVRFEWPRWRSGAWSEDRIRSELTRYLGPSGVFPSGAQFVRDGERRLLQAVRWYGGTERWASEMGVTFLPGLGARSSWTYDRIRTEIEQLCVGRATWPTKKEFDAVGLQCLYETVRRKGLREQLASELGLMVPPHRRYLSGPASRRRWTNDAIRAALDPLVDGQRVFPTRQQLRVAGLSGLDKVLTRTHTRRAWADVYGLPLPRDPQRRPPEAPGRSVIHSIQP